MSAVDLDDVELTSHQLFGMLARPFRTTQGIFEYITAWMFTRDKFAIISFSPVLLLLLTLTGFAVKGWFTSRATVTKNIANLVDKEFSRSDEESKEVEEEAGLQAMVMKRDASLTPKRITPYAELLLKQLVQTESSDARWRYIVALQIGQRQRWGQARQMMRKLAPKEGRGFAPAYAWLAWDTVLRNRVKDHNGKLELISDLQNATGWSGTGPAMFEMLADLLESEGRIGDAIKVLEPAADADAGLSIKLFAIAKKHDRTQHLEEVSERAMKLAKANVEGPRATERDFYNFACLCVMQNDIEQGIRTSLEGLSKFPESKGLTRVLSEAYRFKYLNTLRVSEKGVQCDIIALNEALRADPTNTAVIEEVAKVISTGATASPELTLALEQQLADGRASALTHLLLSERAFREKKPDAAVPHLEAALQRSPNAVAVLNNLSLTLARLSSDNVPRAGELIARAIRMSDRNAELYDSQGEIRMIGHDYVGAVESYENAVNIDGSRIDFRRRLAEAYEKSGLHEMAKVQRAKIEKLAPGS